MSEVVNIFFSKFAEYCKYCKLGMDIDHQAEVTCRSPENHPKGCSWGECNENDCPALRSNLLMNKLDTSFVVYLKSNKPIPKDKDIYFLSPDGVPYKAKKETLEFMSHYRIKAEFERIKEDEQ